MNHECNAIPLEEVLILPQILKTWILRIQDAGAISRHSQVGQVALIRPVRVL